MNKNVIFFGCTLIFMLAICACEKDNQDDVPDSKWIYNRILKSYNNEMVLKWNEAIGLAIDNLTPAPDESRSYAMVTLAIHDALNNVVPMYETYALDNSGVKIKNEENEIVAQMADAAVAQAAHDVLVVVAPEWKSKADELLVKCFAKITNYAISALGVEIGKNVASALLEKRQKDIRPQFVTYPQGRLPGEYKSAMPFAKANPPIWPENAVYAPDWGNVIPFGISSGDQFRPGPPHPVNSPEYTSDYEEVKRLGCNDCPERTIEQSYLGAFFIENSPSAMNRLARSFAIEGKFNGWETARLLALTAMVQADAHICAFEAKYFYNSWRPITAIREGDSDGNDNTVGDSNWIIPLRPEIRPTPPLPSYPSSHAINGAAAAELFRLYFGTDQKTFTVESLSLPGAKRSYNFFTELEIEIALSRIYIGYHFHQDLTEGYKMGMKLADFIYKNNLREQLN